MTYHPVRFIKYISNSHIKEPAFACEIFKSHIRNHLLRTIPQPPNNLTDGIHLAALAHRLDILFPGRIQVTDCLQ